VVAPVVRLREAAFSSRGKVVVAPTTFDVMPGARVARFCKTTGEARALAMMAAGLVRATSGSVSIGEYDPSVQSVHCKRIAAYVPHDPLPMSSVDFERYIEYRAALWSVEPMRARAHAKLLLERLDGLHEAFAYPIVAALLSSPQVLVLDRPQSAYARAILEAAGPTAVFSTHVDPRILEAYAEKLIEGVLV
jgi:ABC-type Na+ transport system ATPase subunit NatA